MKWQDAEVWFSAGHRLGRTVKDDPSKIDTAWSETLIKNHNDRVEPEDLVWLLGGVTGGPEIDVSLSYLSRLNGRIVLVSGLTDRTFAANPDHEEWVRRYRLAAPNVTHIITGSGFLKSGIPVGLPGGFGQDPVWLWHWPYTGDVDSARYRPRPGKIRRWLLHGQPYSEGGLTRRELSVHVATHGFAPISTDDAQQIIRKATP